MRGSEEMGLNRGSLNGAHLFSTPKRSYKNLFKDINNFALKRDWEDYNNFFLGGNITKNDIIHRKIVNC